MHIMHEQLRRIDLNLLLTFDALYRHRTVVAASDELALSPSAFSHALNRLRGALSDELFVRYGAGMQPTAKADQIADGIKDALESLTATLGAAGPFKPSTSAMTFVFAATDFTAFALLPRLAALLERAAPRLRIKVVYSTHKDSADDLAAGRIHFAVGFSEPGNSDRGFESLECFTDEYVVVARKHHPRLGQTLTLEQYLTERHVVVTPWNNEGSVIDAALLKAGHRRDTAVHLPSLMAAPFIVANSDWIITMPRRIAEEYASLLKLRLYPAPFETPGYALKIAYHRRHADTSGHAWMREQILSAFRVP